MRKTDRFLTRKGSVVEYSIAGQGEPILIMHGGHSNCKEEFGYRELAGQGYCIITPSRPGYGSTSKELGENALTACEAYLELLDFLKVPRVHVIAISAGGPSGIHFASRYPKRVRSLTLQSAVTHRWLTVDDTFYKSAQVMFRPSIEKGVWLLIRSMNKIFSDVLFKSMIPAFSNLGKDELLLQFNDDDKRQFGNMLNRQRSGHGFMIDLVQTSQNLESELSLIQCPALIMHSKNDGLVAVKHAYYAQQYIPNSELIILDTWGHLIWMGKDAADMHAKLFEFLKG
ncbi:alpha/beta fold hydrolase [Paenibacillus sp. J5C2022]|uniref:alpha/beta fold hydrolase n=1 Tax=Paenibacillus sp. J5C2022 TaxID=2977129 RepID=UPI00397A3B06